MLTLNRRNLNIMTLHICLQKQNTVCYLIGFKYYEYRIRGQVMSNHHSEPPFWRTIGNYSQLFQADEFSGMFKQNFKIQ